MGLMVYIHFYVWCLATVRVTHSTASRLHSTTVQFFESPSRTVFPPPTRYFLLLPQPPPPPPQKLLRKRIVEELERNRQVAGFWERTPQLVPSARIRIAWLWARDQASARGCGKGGLKEEIRWPTFPHRRTLSVVSRPLNQLPLVPAPVHQM